MWKTCFSGDWRLFFYFLFFAFLELWSSFCRQSWKVLCKVLFLLRSSKREERRKVREAKKFTRKLLLERIINDNYLIIIRNNRNKQSIIIVALDRGNAKWKIISGREQVYYQLTFQVRRKKDVAALRSFLLLLWFCFVFPKSKTIAELFVFLIAFLVPFSLFLGPTFRNGEFRTFAFRFLRHLSCFKQGNDEANPFSFLENNNIVGW